MAEMLKRRPFNSAGNMQPNKRGKMQDYRAPAAEVKYLSQNGFKLR
jgi:hypothetical protein